MTHLSGRVVAYTATRPHLITATLAVFTVLFAGYCTFDLHRGNASNARLAAICAGLALAGAIWNMVRVARDRKTAGRSRSHTDFADLPPSIRNLAELVDASARYVLVDGHLRGVAAADAAVDVLGDDTQHLIQDATCRRALEIAFERETAGQGSDGRA